ncbi:MAG: hypothetical protein LJE95_05110 [Acidobacteria bacterium]|jgi:hypothetical protein|nr:hypothetical protein [Acidobacteriota bacterium]
MRKRLGEMLRASSTVDEEALHRALEVHQVTGERLGTTLLRLRMVDPSTLAALLGEQLEVEGIDPSEIKPSPEALALISYDDATRLGVLPMWVENGTLAVAMSDPTDEGAVAELALLTSCELKRYVAPQMLLYGALRVAFGRSGETFSSRARELVRAIRLRLDELEHLLEE